MVHEDEIYILYKIAIPSDFALSKIGKIIKTKLVKWLVLNKQLVNQPVAKHQENN
jgi:hypothetical protein